MDLNSSNSTVVEASDLRKSYGSVEALRGVSFEIKKGEVFGLLGPNGAGKTTTIEILEGLREPDGGSVRVCGLDPTRQGDELKQRIGAQLQATVLPDKIRVGEAMRLFACFYRRPASVGQLMERFGLTEKSRALYETLSGGQKQRLALALALVNDPELVLMDEPTVGLDVQLRRDIYRMVKEFRREGRTVLLTTHYIEEAERLCDRVAIVDRGRVVALGTPRELVARSRRGSRLEVRVTRPLDLEKLKQLEAVFDCRQFEGAYFFQAQPMAKSVVALIRLLEAENNELLDLHVSQPTLEDVFVELTGRTIREE